MEGEFPVATPDAPPHVRKAVEEYAQIIARDLEIEKKEDAEWEEMFHKLAEGGNP